MLAWYKNLPSSAQRRNFFLAIIVGWCLFAGPWATYTQISLLVTYVTAPVFAGFLYFLFTLFIDLRRPPWNGYDNFLVIIFVFACISYLWTLNPSGWAVHLFWLSVNFSLYLFSKRLSNSRYLLRLSSFLGIFCLVPSIILVDQVFNEWGYLIQRRAIEGHNNNFSAYAVCSAICVACIYSVVYNVERWFKILLLFAFIAAFFLIDLLGTRGAQISLVAMFAALFVPARKAKFASYIVSILFICISLFIVSGLIDPLIQVIDGLSSRSDGELSGRLPTWRSAGEYVASNPILGIGLGAFSVVGPMGIHPHNYLFTLFLDFGVIGTIFFFAWFLLGVYNIPSTNFLRYRILLVFLAYASPISLSGEWIFLPQTWVVFGVMMGVTSVASRPALVMGQHTGYIPRIL